MPRKGERAGKQSVRNGRGEEHDEEKAGRADLVLRDDLDDQT